MNTTLGPGLALGVSYLFISISIAILQILEEIVTLIFILANRAQWKVWEEHIAYSVRGFSFRERNHNHGVHRPLFIKGKDSANTESARCGDRPRLLSCAFAIALGVRLHLQRVRIIHGKGKSETWFAPRLVLPASNFLLAFLSKSRSLRGHFGLIL